MRTITEIGFSLCFFTGLSLAQAGPPETELILPAIPHSLQADLARGSLKVDGALLTLSAGKGSDLYTNADGSKRSDTAPRLLFTPVGNFILTVRVGAAFNAPFDGGALVVYGDSANSAKLLFEHARDGSNGISSTVSKGVGDDAHHGTREGRSVYLKLARRDQLYVFYTSPDGQRWHMVRNFGLPFGSPVRVGFSAQSPLGDSFTAQFSEIRYRPVAFTDFWQGE